MATFWPDNKIGTGDTASGLRRRFSFLSWDDKWIVEAALGQLLPYTDPETFVQIGTATPDDAASYFNLILATFGVDMATTGVIVPFAGGVLPDGWLPCDGRSLAIDDYLALYQAIGTVWGSVDVDHFNIPDLRGRALVGQGTASSGTTFDLGSTGGEENHTLTTTEMPSHTHTDTGHIHTTGNSTTIVAVVPGDGPVLAPNPIPAATSSGNAAITNTGGGGAHNNMQPYAVVNYAIIA